MNAALRISRAQWLWLLPVGLLGIALAVLFVFDPSRVPIYPRCMLFQITGLLCPGCGSLRAVHQLLHGHLWTAFRYNSLLVLSLPVLALLAGQYIHRRVRGQPAPIVIRPLWFWLFLALSFAFGVARNWPGSPLRLTL